MLTTRCSHCRTTFRITSVALHKAAGQVRCGQCSAVFDAFENLTDAADGVTELTDETAQPIPPQQVFKVLEEPTPAGEVPWRPAEPEPEPESPYWRTAAMIAGIALLMQGMHHFRTPLSQAPFVGGVLERVYALAGMPIIPELDPGDFTIVDWVATAQASDESAETGSLAISAGVRNTSRTALPYPMISLELTDRWEETIGARVFTPEEYLGRRISGNARIGANTTVTAQLQLVDPGPDAYGFEVDICVAVDTNLMRCKSDIVFE